MMRRTASGSRATLSNASTSTLQKKDRIQIAFSSDEERYGRFLHSDDDNPSEDEFDSLSTPPRTGMPEQMVKEDSVRYDNCSPKKRAAMDLSPDLAYHSKKVNANPVRNAAKQAGEHFEQKRRPTNEIRNERADEDDDDEEDESSSSVSSREDSDDDYQASSSPKKKQKVAARVIPQKITKKSSKATSISSMADSLLLKAKERSEFDYGEEDSIQKSQEDSRARLAYMDERLAIGGGSQVSISSSTESVPHEAKRLRTCPFCQESMPKKMSKDLIETMQFWLDQYHLKRRIGSTATLEACQQHRDEKNTIPEGRMKGFMSRLNTDKLRLRVRSEKLHFIELLRQRIISPSSSIWFRDAVESRKKYGRQVESAAWQMNNADEMQAGYFGELGWEAIRDTLQELFVEDCEDDQYNLETLYSTSPESMGGLRPHVFIETVLMPELILLLIIDDFKGRKNNINLNEAREIRNESTPYGLALFPSKAMGNLASGRNMFGDKNSKKAEIKAKVQSSSKLSSQKKAIAAGSTKNEAIRLSESPKKSQKGQNTPKNLTNNKEEGNQPVIQQLSAGRPRPRPVARVSKSDGDEKVSIEILSGNSNSTTSQPSNPFTSSQSRLGEDEGRPIILSPDLSHLRDSEDFPTPNISPKSTPSQRTMMRSPSLALSPQDRTVRQRTSSGRIEGY